MYIGIESGRISNGPSISSLAATPASPSRGRPNPIDRGRHHAWEWRSTGVGLRSPLLRSRDPARAADRGSVNSARQSSLRDSVQVLRRRKWIVLAVILIIPAAAIAL